MEYAVVESHIGGRYFMPITSERAIEWIEQRCETCGDNDRVVGIYDTKEEAERLV